MNYIKAYGEQLTAEQYIRKEIISSRGIYSPCSKSDLKDICKACEILIEFEDTKTILYDKIIASGRYTARDLSHIFKIGVRSRTYINEFHITVEDIFYLIKIKFLHPVGSARPLVAGSTKKELLFDAFEYEQMQESAIQNALARSKQP